MNPLAQTRSIPTAGPSGTGSVGTEKIGRFELVEEIGKGSMGVVYLARDPMIGRWVAVKRLTGIKGKLLEPEVVRQLLINEARNVGALEHAGIVTVFDLIEDGNGRVEALAMEYVAGESLRQRLNAPEPLSLHYISEIVSEVAAVLDYAHENGCIHRDIKPANILLAEDGAIKVADFGIAALRGEDLATELRNLGTPNYLAPERVLGQPGDQRADIYSLGVILYELLTRHVPFEVTSVAELVQKIIEEQPTPPERHVPGLMKGLLAILDRALAKDPERRYETAGVLAAEVREVVAAQASLNDTVPAPVAPKGMPPGPVDVEPVEPEPASNAPSAAGEPAELLSPVELALQESIELVELESEAPPAPSRASGARALHTSRRGWAARFAAAGLRLRTALPSVGSLAARLPDSARHAASRLLGRPALAAVLVFALALPALLLVTAGDSSEGTTAVPASGLPLAPEVRYLRLLEEAYALRQAGAASAASSLLIEAEALYPDTREEVRAETLHEIAVEEEGLRLDRIAALAEDAHLQIARTNFAGVDRTLAELAALRAPEELLELLSSSLEQSRRRLRRSQRANATAREVKVAPPVVVPSPVARPVAVPQPPAKTGPGSLKVEFSSARARGVLTVYSGGQQILNRPYRFVEKRNFFVRKGVSGGFSEAVELPEGEHELKIYLSQPKRESQLKTVTVDIPAGDEATLRLRVQADGRLAVGSR